MGRLLILALLIVIASLAALTPAFAAQNAVLDTIGPFDPATCTLDIVFTVEDEGPYFVTVYDDGLFLAGTGGTFPANSTQTVRITIGGPDLTPGVAVSVRDALFGVTTYDFINNAYWSDAQGTACADAGYTFAAEVLVTSTDCPRPLPAGSVVYQIPAGAPTFFAASLDTSTGFNLPAGSWWITQFSGDFAQVWIACEAERVWVPTNAVAR